MVRTFDVYEQNGEDHFQITGLLREIDEENATISGLMKLVVTDKKRLEKTYIRAISNDDVLIGQEKSQIMSTYESLFQSSILLRKRFCLNLHDSVSESVFSCTMHAFNYELHGKLIHNDLQANIAHGTWLSDKLHPVFQEFLACTAEAVQDQELTLKEKDDIVEKLDRFLVCLVAGYFLIRSYKSTS